MFTGIIERTGRVAAIEPTGAGIRLRVDPRGWSHRPAEGESIAVNGCCLTVAEPPAAVDGHLAFDVIPETLRRTTLGDLREGDPVNLEASVTPSTLLGGHIVQGHVDGVGVVDAVAGGDDEHRVRIVPPEALLPYIVEKGSVAIDGVSLTVASVAADRFEVALIPTTLRLTTFGTRRPGDRVNLEADYLVKTVVSWLERTGLTMAAARGDG